MKNDEGCMKNDEGWKMNDKGWWFQAVEEFCFKTDGRTNRQTFAIVESLSWLKIIIIIRSKASASESSKTNSILQNPKNSEKSQINFINNIHIYYSS